MNDKVLGIIVRAQDEASSVMAKVADKAQAFGDGMKKVGLATAAAGVVVTAFAKSSTNLLEETVVSSKKLSRETGMNVEESSKLLAVTKRMGLQTEQVSAIFGLFSKQITDSRVVSGDAADKQADLKNKIEKTKIELTALNGELKKNGDKTGEVKNKVEALSLKLKGYQEDLTATSNPLQRLNIATQNADGSNKDFHEILLSVADRFKEMPGGAQKTALALELFGRSGKDLLPVLNQGSQGITRLEDSADKLGLTLTQKNIGAVSAYIESQKKLKDSTDAVKMAVGSLTTPILTALSTRVNSLIQSFIQSDGPLKTIIVNFLAFGGPILAATGAMLGFLGTLVNAGPALIALGAFFANPYFLGFALVAAGIAAAVLYLRSQFGSWAETMASLGNVISAVWAQLVSALGPAISSLWATVQSALIPALQQLAAVLGPILVPLVRFLATEFGVTLVAALWATVNALKVLVAATSELISLWASLLNWIRQLPGVTKGSVDAAGHFFLSLLSFINPVVGALHDMVDLLNSAKGAAGTFKSVGHSLHIPGFAQGTNFAPGGLAVVGEQGPELVNLPRGSQVIPNGQAAGTTVQIFGNINNSTPEAANAFWNRVDQTQRLARWGMA